MNTDVQQQQYTPLTMNPGEIVIGQLRGFNDNGQPLVAFEQSNFEPIAALSTVAITHQHFEREVALLFTNGDVKQPIIMGVIHSPLLELISDAEQGIESHMPSAEEVNDNEMTTSNELSASVDDKRLVLEGKEEVVLKCGDASITLTKSGKVLIRGKYLLNRATGINRIVGGSVQVN